MARTYADAIASLNTLQTNFSIVEALRASGKQMYDQAIPEVVEFFKRIGYQPLDLKKLNPIHIAGTKGKGSTAAFISSILNQYNAISTSQDPQNPILKTGLYTSPHLRFVRERIQINGQPLSEDQFAKYFFEVWDKLEVAAEEKGEDPKGRSAKPVYFRFLTLMAFHAYIREGVNAAVIECGIGGKYDSTNILEDPMVTAITSLGIDHVGMLGNTLPEIAWHKAGIIKKGVKCFTPNSQKPEAKQVLEKVAKEQEAELVYVDIDSAIQDGRMKLGLQGDFQRNNASIAASVAKEFLIQQGFQDDTQMNESIKLGLERVSWPGRCETRKEAGITWYIDGGHTIESIELAATWYASESKIAEKSSTRFLIFNQQTRDADALATKLHDTLVSALEKEKPFTHAIFCSNTTFKETGFKADLLSVNAVTSNVDALTVQKQLADTWNRIDPASEVQVVRTIEEAVEIVRNQQRELGREVTAFVTGSLHLVGGFLEVLESKQNVE